MQLNIHMSKEDFERDGYWMECDELEFPLLWETRRIALPARRPEITKEAVKLETVESAPLVWTIALPAVAIAFLVGIVAVIHGIRTWKLNRNRTVDQMVEKEGFIEKFDEED